MDSSELRHALKIIDIMLMQQEDLAPHLERLRTLSSQNASGGKYLTEWAADTIDAQAARIAALTQALEHAGEWIVNAKGAIIEPGYAGSRQDLLREIENALREE